MRYRRTATLLASAMLACAQARADEPPSSLFDGRTLGGWEGDSRWWRVEEGALTGGSLAEEIPENYFLVTRQSFGDFELRLRIKLTGTEGFINSGIQIRSVRKPGSTEMIGYQVDAGDEWWGKLYDESRRNEVIAESGNADAVNQAVRRHDWNEYVIRAQGRRIRSWINGVPALDYTERDAAIPQEGLIGIQIHGGGKAVVQVKDVSIRKLPSRAGIAAADPAEVIVTGSRLAEVNRIAPVEVLDAEDLAARGAGNIADVLRHVPGLSVSQPGGPGGTTEVFVRGAESNFTTVMIDGVKVNDPTDSRGGAFDFSMLDPDEVERIEIVRGPVSAVYGSEALAGVINVITRARSENALSARTTLGTHGYSQLSGRFGAPLGERSHVSLRAQRHDAGEPVEGSMLTRNSAQADVLHEVGENLKTEIGLRYTERSRTTFPDASGGPLLAVSRELERSHADDTVVSGRASYQLAPNWSVEVSGSLFERDASVITPAIASGVTDGRPAQQSGSTFRQSQWVLASRYTRSDRFTVGLGVDAQRTTGQREGTLDFGGMPLPLDFSLERHTSAVFAEGWWRATQSVELFSSVRADHGDGADERFSSRIGVAYTNASGLWSTQASWGNGFKLPSFYALGDALVGNPELEQERGTAFDVTGELRLLSGRAVLGLNAFSAVYRDLIDFDFDAFRLVNRARADIDGVGASLKIQAGDAWSFFVHSTRTRTELASGGRLLNRPDWSSSALASWRASSRWVLTSTVQHVGSRAASSVATGDVTLESYARVDFAATYRLSEKVQLHGAVDNLFDAKYQDNPGFPAPGRELRVGIAARL